MLVLPAHAGVIPKENHLEKKTGSSRTHGGDLLSLQMFLFTWKILISCLSIGNHLVLLGILIVFLRIFKNNFNICRVRLDDKCKGT